MKTKITLAFFAMTFLCFAIFAQEAPKNTPSPKPAAAEVKDSLKLTEAELKQGQAIDADIQKASAALGVALEETLTVSAKDQAEAAGWKLSVLYRKLKDTQGQFGAWLEGARKAHNCDGCTIQNGAFVKPPPATTPAR